MTSDEPERWSARTRDGAQLAHDRATGQVRLETPQQKVLIDLDRDVVLHRSRSRERRARFWLPWRLRDVHWEHLRIQQGTQNILLQAPQNPAKLEGLAWLEEARGHELAPLPLTRLVERLLDDGVRVAPTLAEAKVDPRLRVAPPDPPQPTPTAEPEPTPSSDTTPRNRQPPLYWRKPASEDVATAVMATAIFLFCVALVGVMIPSLLSLIGGGEGVVTRPASTVVTIPIVFWSLSVYDHKLDSRGDGTSAERPLAPWRRWPASVIALRMIASVAIAVALFTLASAPGQPEPTLTTWTRFGLAGLVSVLYTQFVGKRRFTQ